MSEYGDPGVVETTIFVTDVVEIEPDCMVVVDLAEFGERGAIGPAGPAGAVSTVPGPAGPAGGTGPRGFEQNFASATDMWIAVHDLGFTPAVMTYDSLGRAIRGHVESNDVTETVVSFMMPVSGRISLS